MGRLVELILTMFSDSEPTGIQTKIEVWFIDLIFAVPWKTIAKWFFMQTVHLSESNTRFLSSFVTEEKQKRKKTWWEANGFILAHQHTYKKICTYSRILSLWEFHLESSTIAVRIIMITCIHLYKRGRWDMGLEYSLRISVGFKVVALGRVQVYTLLTKANNINQVTQSTKWASHGTALVTSRHSRVFDYLWKGHIYIRNDG